MTHFTLEIIRMTSGFSTAILGNDEIMPLKILRGK